MVSRGRDANLHCQILKRHLKVKKVKRKEAGRGERGKGSYRKRKRELLLFAVYCDYVCRGRARGEREDGNNLAELLVSVKRRFPRFRPDAFEDARGIVCQLVVAAHERSLCRIKAKLPL
jgi:hypothetical protein